MAQQSRFKLFAFVKDTNDAASCVRVFVSHPRIRPRFLVRSLAGRVPRPMPGVFPHAHSPGRLPLSSTATLNSARSGGSCGDGEKSRLFLGVSNAQLFLGMLISCRDLVFYIVVASFDVSPLRYLGLAVAIAFARQPPWAGRL